MFNIQPEELGSWAGPRLFEMSEADLGGLVWFGWGLVWLGLVWFWFGLVLVWFGLWLGLVCGLAWLGLAWLGLVCGLAWLGLAWLGCLFVCFCLFVCLF